MVLALLSKKLGKEDINFLRSRATAAALVQRRIRRTSCPSCSEGFSQPMKKISSNLHKCSSCGIVVRNTGIGMEIEPNTWGLGI
jgi:ribosomal protein L37AE/L43A